MIRRNLVTYEWGDRDFSGYSPDISGYIATAKTLPAMRAQLKGALEALGDVMRHDGSAMPDASAAVIIELANGPEFPNAPGYHLVVANLEVSLPRKKRTPTRKTAMRELTAA